MYVYKILNTQPQFFSIVYEVKTILQYVVKENEYSSYV